MPAKHLRSRGAFVLEKKKKIREDAGVGVKCAEVKDDPIKQHRVQSIIAGSIKAYGRLYEAGLIDEKKCSRCGSDDSTLRHVAWHCEHWQHI